MVITNPPHKPPWFPDGDPLDPLTSGQVPIKTPQRYVGDTHQIYDVIVTSFVSFSKENVASLMPCSGIFANPFKAYDLSDLNSVNQFFLFQRFNVLNYPFANNYSVAVHEALKEFEGIYWDKSKDLEFDRAWSGDFGDNVTGNNFQASIEVDEHTIVLVTWFERDADGSNSLRGVRFEGNKQLNVNLYFQENSLLPWSMVISALKNDISSEIKSKLPPEFLLENLNFPSLIQNESNNNEQEVLKTKTTTQVNTKEFTHSIVFYNIDDRCCPPITYYWWDSDDGDCVLIPDIKSKINGKCSPDSDTIFISSSACPEEGSIDVALTYMSEERFFEWVEDNSVSEDTILPNYYRSTGITKATDIEVLEITKTRDITTTNIEETFMIVPKQYIFSDFVHLSKANHNYWNYPISEGSDLGEDIELRNLFPVIEQRLWTLVFCKNNINPLITYNPNIECDTVTNTDINNTPEEVTLKGRYNSQNKLVGFTEDLGEDICANPQQAFRTENYNSKEVTTTVVTIECIEQSANTEFNYALSEADRINIIDSYWYAFFDNNGIWELINPEETE